MFNSRLPKESILPIFSFLSDQEVASCAFVCKDANYQTLFNERFLRV